MTVAVLMVFGSFGSIASLNVAVTLAFWLAARRPIQRRWGNLQWPTPCPTVPSGEHHVDRVVRCFECRAAFTDTTEAGQIEHRRTPCDELPTVEAIDHVRSAD